MQIKVSFTLKSTHLGYRSTTCAFSSVILYAGRHVLHVTCLSKYFGSLWYQQQCEARLGPIWCSDVWVVAPFMQKGACFGFCPVSPPFFFAICFSKTKTLLARTGPPVRQASSPGRCTSLHTRFLWHGQHRGKPAGALRPCKASWYCNDFSNCEMQPRNG